MNNTIGKFNMSSVFKPEVGDMFFAYIEHSDMTVAYLTQYKNNTFQFTGTNISDASLFNSKEDVLTANLNKTWYASHSAKDATILQVKEIFEPHYIIRTHNKIIELNIIWNIKEDGVIQKVQPSDKGGRLDITNDYALAQSILREIKVDRLEEINKEYFKLRNINFDGIIK